MQFSFNNVTAMIFSLCFIMNCRNSNLSETLKNVTIQDEKEIETRRVNKGSVKIKGNEQNGTLIMELKTNRTETKRPEPVKLTMKQGLTMNQILNVYSLTGSPNELCKNHSLEFANGMRAFSPWALKMFDSSSKLQSGILIGNLVEFGNFQQCIEIYQHSQYSPIRGKHCKLKIIPDVNLIKKILAFRNVTEKRFEKVYIFVKNATFDWSVCVPNSCSWEDILDHYQQIIYGFSEGLSINVTLTEKDCYTVLDQTSLTTTEWCILSLFGFYLLFIIICTIIDTYLTPEEAATNKFALIFSLWRNSKQIFAKGKGDTSLDCVHGIRFLSTCYVIIGHRYLMMMFFPVINSLQIMNWVLYYRSTVITGGTLCVDSFFLISGMLVSLGYFQQIEKTKRINWSLFYMYRYLRITPPLAIVVLWYSTLIQHLGSGPLWNDMLEIVQKPCQEYWWATILHVQNYIHPFPLCMTQAWYLTCDMQYYFLSPFILIPFSKGPIIGSIVYIVVYIVSVGLSFYFAWIHKYSGGVPVTNALFGTQYFQYHYITPHIRASTYIIGIGLGYAIYNTRNIKIKIPYSMVVIGWISCPLVMLASLVGCHAFHAEESVYNRWESSIFLSCSRSSWTLGILWIVWACIKGYGGPINTVLSHYLFRVLGRISYAMYLIHMQMQYLLSGAKKQAGYFSDFDALYESFSDLFIMVIVGFLFTICFESPLIKFLHIFFLGGAAKKKSRPITVKPKVENPAKKEKLFTVT